ncbi:MAG: preprotein translocase subunit SecE [Bacillota bacterium]|jgi:preprotein translocase subunit SecE
MAESRKREGKPAGKAENDGTKGGPKKELKLKRDPRKDPKKDQKKDSKKEAPAVKKKPREGLVKASRRYFEGVWHELKKVHWPTRREVIIYTGVVLVAVLLVGVLLWIFDLILSQILGRLIT